jgi:glycerol-3-phosphate dehydrogenase (NAD(P)+)
MVKSTSSFDLAIVIGAGAFGTSIASVLATNFKHVLLIVRSPDVYQGLKKGENQIYLPGLKLPENIDVCLDWKEFEEFTKNRKIELVVCGLPTSGIRAFFDLHSARFSEFFKRGIPFVSLSKGIDPETLELPDDLLLDYFYEYRDLITFFSGPSFAKEIVEKQITLGSLAGRSKKVLMSIAQMMETPYFKVFPSYDVKGVLLGGALKNILAIAGGIVEGLGYNHNTRAAMITRGITEMLRFGVVFNARPETFYGLSGMGDLILTTTGDLSRNKLFGMELAKGRRAQEIITSQRSVVEGYKTAKAAKLLSEKYEVRARIFDAIYSVLYEDKAPKDVIEDLMSTPVRFEIT